MGHVIEKVAVERGHEIVCRIDRDNTEDFGSETFGNRVYGSYCRKGECAPLFCRGSAGSVGYYRLE